jgi:extracellular matrix regulatory protein A
MEKLILDLGFGNSVVAEKVVALLSPGSSPMKRLKDEAKEEKRLIDVTHGRKTRGVVVTESNHIILSSIHVDTLSNRFASLKKQKKKEEIEP